MFPTILIEQFDIHLSPQCSPFFKLYSTAFLITNVVAQPNLSDKQSLTNQAEKEVKKTL